MDSATQDLYYQRLNELIYDEDSIITCPSIAAELKIGLRDAKSLITKYLNDNRHLKPKELAVTYTLSGTLKDKDTLSVQLVKEAELVAKKELFKSTVSEQVFSIQKCKEINYDMVALVNKFNIAEPSETRLLHSIATPHFIKRNLKVKKLPVIQPKPVKPGFFTKLPRKVEPPTELQGTSKEPEKLKPESKPQTKPKSGGIANFFTKAVPKTNGVDKKEIENIKPVNGTVEKHDDLKSEKNSSENEIVEVIVEIEEKMEVNDVEPAEKKVSEKENVKKRRKNKQKSDMPSKKRKRIQEIHDSDSDDMFGDGDENEDIIEKSDEEPERLPVITTPIVSKSKVRKAVDRTYEDEEGFIITKTEYVFESAPEDEEEIAPPVKAEVKPKVILEKKNSTTDSENDAKGAAKKGKKNTKKPLSGKQPTLMSFFKRT